MFFSPSLSFQPSSLCNYVERMLQSFDFTLLGSPRFKENTNIITYFLVIKTVGLLHLSVCTVFDKRSDSYKKI
jgi:hypothetical protein